MSKWYLSAANALNEDARLMAVEHQLKLTKPPGSLGKLETIATQFAAWQGTCQPCLDKVSIRIFAADHGVCAQGVSAFPQAVTAQMVANFATGGAAISVLANHHQADFEVISLGLVDGLPTDLTVRDYALMAGTRDFTEAEAMPTEVFEQALYAGKEQLNTAAQLSIGGEMGIGNTTAASALYCAYLGLSPAAMVGRGTGVDEETLRRKAEVVSAALALHESQLANHEAVLQCLGGLEIAALCGYFIASAQQGIPVLVDGFICTAAAVAACKINPSIKPWLLFAHCSAEQGHQRALQWLEANPILDLGMRLGEGSGAAVAIPMIQQALILHANMATFEQAGVSGANNND